MLRSCTIPEGKDFFDYADEVVFIGNGVTSRRTVCYVYDREDEKQDDTLQFDMEIN